MKVLYITRSTLYTAPGGDTVQLLNTARFLKNAGVDVDIRLASDKINYQPYDLLHFFNITRPADILAHISKSRKPYVVSPIFVDYSEYDSLHRKGIFKLLYKIFSSEHTIEYFKAIARSVKNKEQINSLEFLVKGQKKSIQYILKHARCVLPNSESEYNRLTNSFGIQAPYKVIPNAIDPSKFGVAAGSNEDFFKRDKVLCVARFEGLKNQQQLIKALNGTDYNVQLVGKPSPNQKSYFDACVSMAAENIAFIPHVAQDSLPDFYKNARVHVLPSWFETTGLSSLEAAAMGCNIVITDKGDQREYFKDYAFYCNPASASSLAQQVSLAYHTPPNPALRQHVLQNYTWQKAADKTLEGYKLALSK